MNLCRLRAPAAATLTCALMVASALSQEPPPASSFSERIEVTAVTVPILAVAQGGPVESLAPGDLAVLEDGQPVPVIALERVPLPARAAPVGSSQPLPGSRPGAEGVQAGEPTAVPVVARPWRILIYVDVQLAGIDSIREAAWQLGGQAERLAALGEVEIWLADDDARRVFGPSSDAGALKKALRKAVANHFGQRRLQRVRLEFLQNTDRRPGLSAGGSTSAARAGILEEARLLEARRALVQDLLAERSVPDWPQAAFVVSGGFDLAPSEFYLPMVGTIADVADAQRLELEFASWSQSEPTQAAARQLSALGWTVVPIVPYDSGTSFPGGADQSGGAAYWRLMSGSAMSTPPPFLVRKPLEPWQIVGETTGGEVVADVRKLDDAVDRLGQRWLMTYQISRRRDGSVHRLEVRGARPGLEIHAPEFVTSGTPEAVAAGRARALLEGRAEQGDLAVTATVQTLPGDGKGKRGRLEARVEFAALGAARQALTSTTLRFTVAVPRSDGGVTVLHEQAQAADLTQHAGWIYAADLLAAPTAKSVAVVVEEMATGAWGATVAKWGS